MGHAQSPGERGQVALSLGVRAGGGQFEEATALRTFKGLPVSGL